MAGAVHWRSSRLPPCQKPLSRVSTAASRSSGERAGPTARRSFTSGGSPSGWATWYALSHDFFALATARRIELGAAVGVLAYAGVSLLGDALLAGRSRGRIRSWRAYLVEALLGGFIGAGLGFYLDTSQVPVVLKKFQSLQQLRAEAGGRRFLPATEQMGSHSSSAPTPAARNCSSTSRSRA